MNQPRDSGDDEGEPLLALRAVDSGYRGAQVLHGVTLEVMPNEIVGVLGANGAGKSTLLGTISGLVRRTAGEISFAGRDVSRAEPAALVRAGVGHVLEGARIFPQLTVRANLRLGAYSTKLTGAKIDEAITDSCTLFPSLAARLDLPAAALSGGERQMLAIAQALIPEPRLLLLDEPSAGLAPIAVQGLVDHLRSLHTNGLTILLVEQSVPLAAEVCDRLYGMREGRIIVDGVAPAQLVGDVLRSVYL
jgi:branched-chain amino acid transport system ATP-binding protein